jgi:hypothetical protein
MSDQQPSGQSVHLPVRCTARLSTRASTPRKRAGSRKPCTSRKEELSAEDRAWAQRVAARLGPLTTQQREALALLLRSRL